MPSLPFLRFSLLADATLCSSSSSPSSASPLSLHCGCRSLHSLSWPNHHSHREPLSLHAPGSPRSQSLFYYLCFLATRGQRRHYRGDHHLHPAAGHPGERPLLPLQEGQDLRPLREARPVRFSQGCACQNVAKLSPLPFFLTGKIFS